MKKISRILSVFLVIVTMFSVCSMMAGAISASSKKEDMLKYYENCLTTTAKKGLVEVKNTWKYKMTADYTGLSKEDATATKELDEKLFGKGWNVEETTDYYYGISDKNQYVEGQPDTVWMFSIKRRINEFGLKFKSASLKKAENGDITITFNLTEKIEDGSNKITITTKTSKSGLIKSFVMKQEGKYKDVSLGGVKYPVTESSSDTYKFVYKKVAVKKIELSQTSVTMGLGESCDVSVTVKPSDATYKGFYCTIDSEDTGDMVAEYVVNDNGTITLTGINGGQGILRVYSYDGSKVAECEVTVTVTFAQAVENFFRSVLRFFLGFFPF